MNIQLDQKQISLASNMLNRIIEQINELNQRLKQDNLMDMEKKFLTQQIKQLNIVANTLATDINNKSIYQQDKIEQKKQEQKE